MTKLGLLASVLALTLAVHLNCAMAEPALWAARSLGATVYLFGTIHVLPAADTKRWMGGRVHEALDAATELWTEADISSLSGSVSAIRRYGLDPNLTTLALLPARYRERFVRQVVQGGIPETLIAHARPWLAEILLNGAAMQKAGPMILGVDATLLAYARAHHMSTPTFETLDSQFALLADMPQAVQLASLEEQIDQYDQAGQLFDRLLAAWRAGDEAALDRLTNHDMRSQGEQVWTELILRRNERFAQKIGDRLQGSGTAFVAVGAAHLCGSDGIPALLKNAGYTVTRLQ